MLMTFSFHLDKYGLELTKAMRIRHLFILMSLIFTSFTISAQASAPENAGLNEPLPINWSLLATEKENFYVLQIPDSPKLKAILAIEQEVPKNKFHTALLDQKLIELTTPLMEEKQILAGDFYRQGHSEHQKGMQTIFVKKILFQASDSLQQGNKLSAQVIVFYYDEKIYSVVFTTPEINLSDYSGQLLFSQFGPERKQRVALNFRGAKFSF